MFLYKISESKKEQEDSQESSKSIRSKIDNLEETLQRKLRVDGDTSFVIWDVWVVPDKMVCVVEK